MQINRHNYEEFFILYMDNELGMEERRHVEEFVVLHPDLKEELELLQHFRLQPDTDITFTGKEELLKINGDTPVTLTNYEEWFTPYIDNELTAVQRKAVEDFIEKNPATAKDLLVFQRTRLQPETVVFAGKASLYRSERERRLVPVRWWRMAAAAVLVIGLGLATYLVLDRQPGATPGAGVARTTGKDPVLPTQKAIDDSNKGSEAIAADITNRTPVPVADVQDREDRSLKTVNTANVPKTGAAEHPVIIDPAVKEELVKVERDNNLPRPVYNPNINTPSPSIAIMAANEPQKQKSPALTIEKVTTPASEPSDFVNATFREDEGNERQDGKKNKLRGFFRKVTRTFEKRTNMDATTDDNKLLVAGLAISLK